MGMEWVGRDFKDYLAPTPPCSDVLQFRYLVHLLFCCCYLMWAYKLPAPSTWGKDGAKPLTTTLTTEVFSPVFFGVW